METVSANQFSATRDLITIPVPGVQNGDTETALLSKITAALTGGGSGAGSLAALIRAAGSQTSGSIATGGTAQEARAANAARNVLVFVNTSNATLHVNASAVATYANGIPVLPGGSVNFAAAGFLPTGALSVIGPITGQTFITIQA